MVGVVWFTGQPSKTSGDGVFWWLKSEERVESFSDWYGGGSNGSGLDEDCVGSFVAREEIKMWVVVYWYGETQRGGWGVLVSELQGTGAVVVLGENRDHGDGSLWLYYGFRSELKREMVGDLTGGDGGGVCKWLSVNDGGVRSSFPAAKNE